ncbi:tetratricopeptide repeat protein [Thiohalobacter sp. IOR34]|uniref:tetratricopeptide repeat protein n=1 Tax=Thiohalobacter sp. IOR34 TaxID=3057176 RepID=UPI0025B26E9C|nr:tetratricopeptide repeat protein [Thiohalobacter sp. IOR34]WJW76796.1 tetratricopeptide repeat protein [Thiohalobacter sp. IOR34]
MKPATLILVPLLAALSGCNLLPSRPAPAESAPAAQPASETATLTVGEPLTGPLLFDILLAEVAGQRKRLDVAVSHYLRAAQESADPRVAERALRVALFAKDHQAALVAARRWVALEPERVEARQMLAALALEAGRRDKAKAQLEAIITQLGVGASAFQSVVGLLARDQDREAALSLMGEIVADHPQLPEAHLAYSQLALHAGRAELALAEVEQALALKPGWIEALVQRAKVQVRLKRLDEAVAGIAAAVKTQPKDTLLRRTYAQLLLQQGELEAARKQFQALLRHDPDNADAIYSLGLLALERKDLKAAEKRFRRLLALGKREQAAYYYLGRIAEERDDVQAARDWYGRITQGEYLLDGQVRSVTLQAESGDLSGARQQLHKLRLRHPQLALRLYLLEGQLLTEGGQYPEAMKLYSSVLAEYPDNVDLRYARALLAEKMDDLALAESDLRQIIEAHPENAHALNALGYTLADRTDRFEEALSYIEKAYKLSPEEPAILDSLGWVHYRLGNLDEAEKWLRKAYGMNPDPEIGAHLAEVLWMAGKRDEARRLLAGAAERGADNPVLRETRQRLLKAAP